MTVGYLLLVFSLVVFGGAAVLALAWAVSHRQLEDFPRASRTIFTPDEPIGEMTDTVWGKPPTTKGNEHS